MIKILLVEDDAQVRYMLRESLEQAGYKVAEAQNASEAMAQQAKAAAALVITDIIMPGGNGVQAIVRLRHAWPGLPIFAISGGSPHVQGTDLLEAAMEVGADRTFAKPLDIDELLRAASDVLEAS